MDQIESKKILTEGEDRPDAKKKETSWTDKSGKKHPATQVQGHQSVKADKEADKEKKKNLDEMNFQGAIAQALLKEFDIVSEEENEELDEAGNPWANDPEKSAAWSKLSPEDQKWLGGADPTDPYILARAPNKGKPAAGGAQTRTLTPGAATKPAAGAATKPAAGAANPATGVNAQGQNVTMPDGTNPETGEKAQAAAAPLTTPPGAEPEAPQASTLAEPPGADGAATKPAIDPAKLARFKELLAKASQPTAAKEATELRDDQILALIRGI